MESLNLVARGKSDLVARNGLNLVLWTWSQTTDKARIYSRLADSLITGLTEGLFRYRPSQVVPTAIQTSTLLPQLHHSKSNLSNRRSWTERHSRVLTFDTNLPFQPLKCTFLSRVLVNLSRTGAKQQITLLRLVPLTRWKFRVSSVEGKLTGEDQYPKGEVGVEWGVG